MPDKRDVGHQVHDIQGNIEGLRQTLEEMSVGDDIDELIAGLWLADTILNGVWNTVLEVYPTEDNTSD